MKNLKNKLLITVTLSILLSSNILAIDYTWHCKGDVVLSTIYGWSSTSGNHWASFGFENNSDALPNLYGEIDNANCAFSYWDDTSPVCGGDGTSNILIEAYCDSSLGSGCWDVLLGVGENPLMEIVEEKYTNALIFVNKMPCMPRDTTNFTFGAYEWDNNTDLGLANANLNKIFDEYIYLATEQEATEQRAVCFVPDPNAPIDYTVHLNQIITNTSQNSDTVSKLTNIDNRQQTRDDDLDSFIQTKSIDTMMNIDNQLDGFNTTFETTIGDTYSTYSDIFGFGGYGVAPEPISFTMFTKEYKVFDPTVLNPHIDMIRNTFVIFAYLWGFIIVFKNT